MIRSLYGDELTWTASRYILLALNFPVAVIDTIRYPDTTPGANPHDLHYAAMMSLDPVHFIAPPIVWSISFGMLVSGAFYLREYVVRHKTQAA